MKKLLTMLLIMLLLVSALTACTETLVTPDPTPSPDIGTEPAPQKEPEPQEELESQEDPELQTEPEQETATGGEILCPRVTTYTTEQIQAALQDQFMVGGWGEGNPQVIAVQRVTRDRDYIRPEAHGPDGQPIDLTNAARYRVETRFRQSLEDYTFWAELYAEMEFNPFRRDGDYTILTDYFYFNDVDGEPVLAFVSC